MKIPRRKFLHLAAGTAALPALSWPASGQTYPTRPVTLIVPLPAGTSTDVALRSLASATQEHLGRPIVIENRSGASTTLGPAQMASTAKPDGYTVAAITVNIFRAPFMKKTTYDPSKDFTYIIRIADYTFGVVVRGDAPWKNFQELLADARNNPGKITYGSPGVGTTPHILMEQIAKRQGLKWVHVPFSGGPPELNALLGGHIDAAADASAWAPQVNAGQLRLLVTFGAARSKSWPSVPTLKDIGIDMEANSPYGIAGPRGVDPALVKILHDAFKRGMEEPAFLATMAMFDQEDRYLRSEDYQAYATKQIAEEKRMVEELGLKEE